MISWVESKTKVKQYIYIIIYNTYKQKEQLDRHNKAGNETKYRGAWEGSWMQYEDNPSRRMLWVTRYFAMLFEYDYFIIIIMDYLNSLMSSGGVFFFMYKTNFYILIYFYFVVIWRKRFILPVVIWLQKSLGFANDLCYKWCRDYSKRSYRSKQLILLV